MSKLGADRPPLRLVRKPSWKDPPKPLGGLWFGNDVFWWRHIQFEAGVGVGVKAFVWCAHDGRHRALVNNEDERTYKIQKVSSLSAGMRAVSDELRKPNGSRWRRYPWYEDGAKARQVAIKNIEKFMEYTYMKTALAELNEIDIDSLSEVGDE